MVMALGIYLKLVKKNQKILICNLLDLGTLGFSLIMSKNLYGFCTNDISDQGDFWA